jgi:tetratricopeptide (TPR) repeat protein
VQRVLVGEADVARSLQGNLGAYGSEVPIPFAIDEEMAAYARKVTRGYLTTPDKTNALIRAITTKAGLDVRYEATATLTAREVFDQRRANCISFTSLFVALARSVGIEAYYADVTERSRYVRRAGTVLHIGHTCAIVRDGPQLLLVDFADESRRQYLGYRIIDDLEALASFVINQGVDFGELLGAPGVAAERFQFTDADIAKLELALRIRPGYSKALLNLGTAYLLRGETERPEDYFRKAVRSDPFFGAGYTALGNLMYSQRRFDEALDLYRTAVRYNKKNPYLFYSLALTNFTMRRYKEADRAARTAARLDANFADVHYLLGIIAQVGGKDDAARQSFLRALTIDPALDDARVRLKHLKSVGPVQARTVAASLPTGVPATPQL